MKRKYFRDIKDEPESDKGDTQNDLDDALHLQIKSLRHKNLSETHYIELGKFFLIFFILRAIDLKLLVLHEGILPGTH